MSHPSALPTSSAPAAQIAPGLSPGRRAWLRFKRNRLGFWSLVAFCVLVALSLCAELVSNDRPLVVRYQGQTYFPMLKDYPEKTFGGDFDTATDYLDPFIRQRLSEDGNWSLFAPNPYGPRTLNYFAAEPNPSRPTRANLLGTDERGRDLLAQLIYGFRVSVLFALALTLTGTVLGVITGAIQDSSVVRPTWRSSASSRFGVRCRSCICSSSSARSSRPASRYC